MGFGAAYDLVQSPGVEAVTLADIDAARAEAAATLLASPDVSAATVDVSDHASVVELMRGHDSAISCVVYHHNLGLARAALEAGVNFCDLGGNNAIVAQELALDADARSAGINIIPDCGLAPGMVSVLVAHGAARFEHLDEVHVRVGGLPQQPRPPLDYQIVFSVEGLINEYVEPARIIRDGRIVEIESMTEIESLEFAPPFGLMEAFHTSGGTSTLPDSFLGKVRQLDHKTIRFPGHCGKFKLLLDLGLASSEAILVDGARIIPRNVLGELLMRALPADQPDVVLVRIEFHGRQAGSAQKLIYDIADYYDEQAGLSAMMRTTAFPASIIAQMMARGEIASKGAIPQERCVQPESFMRALADRNILITERMA